MRLIERMSFIDKKHGRVAMATYEWNGQKWNTITQVTGKWNEETQPKYWAQCEKSMLNRIEHNTQMLKNTGLNHEYVI